MATSVRSQPPQPVDDEYAAFPLVEQADEYAAFPLVQKAADDDEYAAFPIVEPVVAEEAQRATLGAVQALDVMGAPRQLDWSQVNEQMDAQRLQEADTAIARAALAEEQGSGTGPGSEAYDWRREAEFQRGNITPFTSAGQTLAQQEQNTFRAIEETANSQRPETPSSLLSSVLGPGLSSTVQPVIESTTRNAGSAIGGAAGAAAFIPHPGAQLFARIGLPLAGAIGGSMAGGYAQEGVLQIGETPEQTQNRQQLAAEDFARNPGLTRLGAALASAPFFGPSIAQFGRAVAGDRGAILNLGLSGSIGAGAEIAAAAARGETAKAEDIAAAFFSNVILNEPTKLGRRMGLQPSTEQLDAEARAIQAEQPPIPIGEATPRPPTTTEPNAQQISKASPTDGGSLPQPEVTEGAAPVEESSVRVQPSRPGEPLAEAAPAPPREVISDEARIAKLVEAGMDPADAAAGLARIKAAEVPPAAAEPPAPPAEPPTAARASEAPPELPGATSNKEAVVNAERAARDLDPIIKEARIENTAAIDRAQQIVTENPLKPQEIVTRLRTNPQERTISLEDSAVLLVERTKLNKTREELLSRATDETLDPTERATAKAEFETIETRLNELDQAAQDARSTWGRFGQLWQRSMRQDFSLANMERRARLNKGEALSPEESAQIKTIADEVAVKQREADAAVQQAETAAVEKQVDATISQIAKQPDLEPAVRSLADRIIAKLDLQAEAARKRLRERFKKVGSAPDPLIVADFAIMAATRIAKTSIKAGQWFSEMVKEFGEGVRPYLQAAWDAADKKLDELVNSGTGDKKKRATVKAKILSAGAQQERVTQALAERVKEGQSLDTLGNYIDRLVDSFVAGGIRDRNALTAAVKGVLEPLSPGITDRKVHELISGYGQSTQLSKDPLKVVKRQLKGELQQVSKLEALAAKEPLKKTGPERRTPSDEERRLIKQVNEAKKAAGVVTTDPATQLKSTMGAARTRMTNEIKDLTFEIETGQRPPTKTPIQYAEDIEIMRGLRDRLRETIRELEGPRQLSEEQRIAITTRGLQDSIAALESRIAAGVESRPQAKRLAPDTPEIRALKAKRDALRAELKEIESADFLLRENRKAEALVRSIEQAEAQLAGSPTRPARQQGPESELVMEARTQLAAVREQLQAKRDADPLVQQERMEAAEAAVERAIKKLDEQIQAGDLSVQRAPTPAGSQRLEDLRMQRDAMSRLRAQLRAEARPKPNPLDVAIKARKSQLARQEADYEARIAAGDFGPRTRKPPVDISGDPVAMAALARVQEVKDKFAKLQKEWELKNRTRTEKVLGGIKATWDAVRNLKLSMDLSAPLQTAFAMAAHPIEGAKAMTIGARAAFQQFFRNSDALAQREQQRIANSPNNKNGVYKDMKLELSLGDKREENAGSVLERLADLESRWAGIPDFVKGLIGMNGQQLVKGTKQFAKALPKLVGLGIKASNASFNAVANHMRSRTADAILARWARRRGAPTKQQLELLGNQINAATGKGGLRGEEGIRALLFAPNYYLSILKQLSFQPAIKAGIKHEGAVAREVLEEYVRAAITMASIWGLQQLFGNRDKQTLDPRSQDFARAKTDRGTSLDFTMGRGAYITLAAQLATSEKINKKGRVEKQDAMSAFLNFLKGRLSREISTSLTTAKGKDFRGKDVDPAQLAKDLVAPLSWQDVDKVIKREGLTRGTFIQMLNLIGVTHRMAD